MKNTGTYIVSNGHLVKVSDRIPRVASRIDGAYCPQGGYYESFNGRDKVWIPDKQTKKRVMAEKGIMECPDKVESDGKHGVLYSWKGMPPRRSKEPKPIPPNLKPILQSKYSNP